MRKISLLYQPGGRRIWPARMFFLHRRPRSGCCLGAGLLFSLGDEIIHRGRLGIYWGKYSEETYTKTAYHRQVLKMLDYRLLDHSQCQYIWQNWPIFKEIIKEIRNDIISKINETAAFWKAKEWKHLSSVLILGSGLGELAEEIENPVVVDYSEIPNWGRSTVVGHAGKLVYGELDGRKVLALQGRFHFYEGNPLEVVTFLCSCHESFGLWRGSLLPMLLVVLDMDQVPWWPSQTTSIWLVKPIDRWKFRWLWSTFPWYVESIHTWIPWDCSSSTDKLGIKLDDGVYIGVTGPTYETPAEIRAFKTLGADAVGNVNCSWSHRCCSLWFEGSWYFMYYQLWGWFPRRAQSRRSSGSDRARQRRLQRIAKSDSCWTLIQWKYDSKATPRTEVTSSYFILGDWYGSGRNCLSLSTRRGTRTGLWPS